MYFNPMKNKTKTDYLRIINKINPLGSQYCLQNIPISNVYHAYKALGDNY